MDTAETTWQHSFIQTNGIRMHYVKQGSGPLVIFLHGFPEFWYSWRYQLPVLAEHGYTAVAPDLRGYNETDKPAGGYDLATLCRDIAGLISGLQSQKAIIIGHDWGGVLAWSLTIHHPELAERLIVLNAPHPAAMSRELRTIEQLRKSWYMFFFQIPWLPEYLLGLNHAAAIGKMLHASAVQKAAFPPQVLWSYRDAMSKPGALTGGLNYYRAMFRRLATRGRSGNEHVINTPTLLIWGEQDVALGINLTKGLENWVPNLRIQYLPESGHWVQQENPEEVNKLILEFLSTS
ncbi:alpha/beta hydrolase [Ktedonosporobacter rubrisoli]|uniref:Alpha/beta hydrolase n=1 Tax=Ktedonosporobacter rubrisoli TaxID=2509675 RepID=A0A4P6JW57_KTERU|nr:alpha/beta hydrolase [Ktedonosporobacter rubrisoli]QBD79705.1 alpha/beta hydrolase [Ktedonosporobacter rubrisoli]